MPYDTGWGQFVNSLTNPPNPLQQFGGTVDLANKLKQFQADKAIADIYGQSIDPTTGQVDLNKFNALASQNPAALWKYGTSMQQAGQGLQAQGAGTSAQVQAAQDQLGAQAAYLSPLMQKIMDKQPVTAAEVQQTLDSMPPGLINPTLRSNLTTQLAQMGPNADASNLVRGANFANQHAREILRMQMPSYGGINLGGGYLPTQANPLAPGGSTYPTAPLGYTPTPGEQIQQNQWLNNPMNAGGTYLDRNGNPKKGTVQDWLNDFGTTPNSVRVGGGGFTAPGASTFTPDYGAAPAGPAPSAAPPSGAPAPAPRVAPAPAPRAAPQQPAPPSAAPNAVPQPPPAPVTPPPPAPAPQAGGGGRGGVNVIDPTVAATGQQAYNDATLNMPQSQARRTTIALGLQALQGAEVGGGTENIRAIRNVLATYSPAYLTRIIPGYDPEKMATDDALATKYMQQITNANIPGGQGTNEKLYAAAQATPNPKMPTQASQDVLQVMDASELMQQHVFKLFQATGQPPAQYAQFAAKWATSHDPRAFMLPFMSDEQKQYLKDSMKNKPKQAQNFNDTVHELVTSGDMPDPRKTPGSAGTTE